MLIKYKKTIKCVGVPLCLSATKNEIFIVDNTYVFYRISRNNFATIDSKRITQKFSPHHNLYRGFSADGHKIAVTFAATNLITLFDVKEDIKKIGTVNWHTSQVEASLICTRSGYLFSGGQDGKVYMYDLNSFAMIGVFPQKPDYISNIAAADEKSFIAISSFNKQVSIHDFDKNKEIASFFTLDVVQNTLFFDNDNMLFIVCRGGNGGIFDVKNKEIKCSKKFFSDWPTATVLSKDKRHALIGTRDGYLHAIFLQDNTERFKIRVKEMGISNLHMENDYLFVSYFDGVTELFDVNAGDGDVVKFIEEKDYEKAREALNANLMLFLHPVVRLFDKEWSEIVGKIKEALMNGNLESANKMALPFLFDNIKKEQFNELVSDIEGIKKFKEAYDAENYTVAYELAEKEPILKQLPIYDSMEAKWEKLLQSFKTIIQNNPTDGKNKCAVILKPFVGIPSKRKIAQDVINNAQTFIEAENAIAAHDFQEYYRLVKARPFLKETPMYKKMEALSLRTIEKVNSYLKASNYSDAIKLAKSSLKMAPIEEQLKKILVEISDRLKLISAVASNDLKAVYDIVKQHEDFVYLKEFDLVEQKFKEKIKKATDLALSGSSVAVYEELNFYFNIEFRLDKVAQIMKLAYLNEIKNNSETQNIDWEKTFKTYCEYFSKDAELKKIAKEIEKEAILEKVDSEKDSEFGYRKKELENSVIVFF